MRTKNELKGTDRHERERGVFSLESVLLDIGGGGAFLA